MSQSFTLTPDQIRELDMIRKMRRERIKDAFAASRQRIARIKKVRLTLAASAEPMTVPELAEATGLSATDVLWCVTAMKKYGIVGEHNGDDGYYRYGLEDATADVPEDDD